MCLKAIKSCGRLVTALFLSFESAADKTKIFTNLSKMVSQIMKEGSRPESLGEPYVNKTYEIR